MEALIERYSQSAAATCELGELEPLTSSTLAGLGFDSFMLRAGTSLASVEYFGRYDRRLMAEYRLRRFDLVDPVARQVNDSWLPVMWDAQDLAATSVGPCAELFRRTLDAGYKCGISVPINGPFGQTDALVGIYRGDAANLRLSCRALSNDLMVLGVHLAQAYHRITNNRMGLVHLLTPREGQCLSWTSKGKTAWEIAEIIGISERTVNFHMQNAMAKLQCSSKYSACLTALRLRLIKA